MEICWNELRCVARRERKREKERESEKFCKDVRKERKSEWMDGWIDRNAEEGQEGKGRKRGANMKQWRGKWIRACVG